MKKLSKLEGLRQEVELIRLRVQSGQSFMSAASQASGRYSRSPALEKNWAPLRKDILEGKIGALQALGSFHSSLDFQIKAQKLLRKKALLPIAQAYTVCVLCVLFYILAQTLFRESLQLSPTLSVAVLLLIGTGLYWIHLLVRSYKECLWYLGWLSWMDEIRAKLSWGQSLLQATQDAETRIQALPRPLKDFLCKQLRELRNYQVSDQALVTLKRGENAALLSKCAECWLLLHNLFLKNEKLLPLLEAQSQRGLQDFQDLCEIGADKLALKIMLPLFVCFAPAYLALTLLPLFLQLQK